MSALTLLILRLGFLLVLWLFVFAIVYALRSDLFGARRRVRADSAPAAAPQRAAPVNAPVPVAAQTAARASAPPAAPVAPRSTGHPKATLYSAGRLVVTGGPNAGHELRMGNEPVTIGRAADSTLVIRDDYTSTRHARLMLWNDEWMLQDLDSTNGTFLDGKRVTVPAQIHLDTPIKIGSTTFELRR